MSNLQIKVSQLLGIIKSNITEIVRSPRRWWLGKLVTPSPHPTPPPYFNSIKLPVVPKHGAAYRVNSSSFNDARHFGCSGRGRWDGPDQGYNVMYVGDDVEVAFIECYGRNENKSHLLQSGKSPITDQQLRNNYLAEITPNRSLRFVKVHGSALTRINADARLASGAYFVSREWGRAFHQHKDNVDGICYRSRHDDDRFCYAIFDRVGKDNFTQTNLGQPLADYSELQQILDEYNFVRIDDRPVKVLLDSEEMLADDVEE